MIVEGDVPSKKIDENDFAIVVVSKRAVTKGHVLVIPKSAVGDEKEMPESVGKLADSIAKRLKSKMKARDVKREITKAFGEIVIDLIPDYGDGIDKGKAYEASDEEIQEVHDKLWVSKVEKPKVIKIKKKKANIKPIKLKRRIP
jgi:diadenosine tetraphosphate (Ap4A) HIT family hydrolase